jgi:RNA polymerase sigma-70 factor (ECF subfamily)
MSDVSEMGEMPELDPEIAAMLRREGARVEVPAEAAARVGARVGASIGAVAAPVPGGGAAAAASATAKLLPFVITFVVGAGVGGGVVALVRSPADAPRAVTSVAASNTGVPPAAVAAVPSVAPSASIASVSVDALPAARIAASSTSASSRTLGADAAAEDTFVAERKLLDVARAALARGDHTGATRTLDEHVTTYPNGRLVEEREALRIRTLADSGRIDEARAVADRFRARFPHSVLLPAVDAAVQR